MEGKGKARRFWGWLVAMAKQLAALAAVVAICAFIISIALPVTFRFAIDLIFALAAALFAATCLIFGKVSFTLGTEK